MEQPQYTLDEWLDDLSARFIHNLHHEELSTMERFCFQIEECQWFYEDFIRPMDPTLPSMQLKQFAKVMLRHCPLTREFSDWQHQQAFDKWMQYKVRVPVRGAIMLNDDMTKVVLVKGWKKGSKWSFPRGKINKNEKDLVCAVREALEETGFDLKGAGLVGPDEEMHKIHVAMREQDMLLYVFRGVPLDAYFNPKTRKEISAVEWYNISDLPTQRRKAGQVHQGAGQDLLMKDSNFYMVAPFLGPLKGWIKQQRKLDKQDQKGAKTAGPPRPTAEAADNDGVGADAGDTTADEALFSNKQSTDPNFGDLVANLGRGHRSSDALPEVSAQQEAQQMVDPAEELKRLLSVGGGLPAQTPPVEAPPQGPAQPLHGDGLLAMLQSGNRHPQVPHTPMEQLISVPQQPDSPHHQHVFHRGHSGPMPPPPHFDYHHQRENTPFRGPMPLPMPPQPADMVGHPWYDQAQQPSPGPPQRVPLVHSAPYPHQSPALPVHAPHIHRTAPHIQQAFNTEAYQPQQRIGDPLVQEPPRFPETHGPAILPAPKVPPPKLTAHALGLLNVIKGQDNKPPVSAQIQPALGPSEPNQNSHMTPRMQQSAALHRDFDSLVSPPQGAYNANRSAPGSPPFQSPPPNANFQPAQPKPRSAHQDSLLNLFRSPSVSAATPPPTKRAEPVELSAQPTTPGYLPLPPAPRDTAAAKSDPVHKANLLAAFGAGTKKPDLTSATVSGPVNVPDFETVKKNAHTVDPNAYSRGPSPRGPSLAQPRTAEKQTFNPKEILKRDSAGRSTGPREGALPQKTASPKPKNAPASQQSKPFQPQILKRPQQSASPATASGPTSLPVLPAGTPGSQASPPPAVPSPSHHPVAPAGVASRNTFDRRDTTAADQKVALLSLFGKTGREKEPSSSVAKPAVPKSPVPPQSQANPPTGRFTLPPTASPLQPTANHSPQLPPTPKDIVSGVISPISPLQKGGSQTDSPAHLASRSRISSIGEAMPPNIVIPPTSDPGLILKNGNLPVQNGSVENTAPKNLLSTGNMTDAKGKGTKPESSPVDKTFLLSFLEDVARRAR